MVHLFVSLTACVFIWHYIGARLRGAESTKDLLAAKKENLANGVYGPPVSITEGDRLHSYYLRKKKKTALKSGCASLQLSNKLFQ